MTTRLSVNINDETAAALRELAERHETSVTEIVRRATGLYKFVRDETADNARHLETCRPNGTRRTRIYVQ